MVVDLIRVFSGIRPEAVFLPPALFGYIAYLKQDLDLFIITGTIVISAAVVHDIAEELDQQDENEQVKFTVDEESIALVPLQSALLIYLISSVTVPFWTIYEFSKTYNLYLGIGIFLYLILTVKLLKPFKRYRKRDPEN